MADYSEFSFPSAICGFHVYKDSWNPYIGQQLQTERELDNPDDTFAVAVVEVKHDGARKKVGHIIRSLSRLLSHFMMHGREVVCEVTG